jgi:hypothetical protein
MGKDERIYRQARETRCFQSTGGVGRTGAVSLG